MSGFALELLHAPPAAVDASPLLPERLQGISSKELGRLELAMGRHTIAVGDLFRIHTHTAQQLRLIGDCRGLLDIAAGMEAGTLVVEGSAGDRAGREMAGGRLAIEDSAGDYCACGMRGGEIQITGDVGALAASPLPGQRAGMRGGRLVVGGRAGRRMAYRMRRGTIVLRGPIGAAAGAQMIAGTIASREPFPPDAGIGIHRGTLLTATASPPPAGGRFTPAIPCQLDFLRLLARDLLPDLPEVAERLRGASVPPLRSIGDVTCGGRAEWICLP